MSMTIRIPALVLLLAAPGAPAIANIADENTRPEAGVWVFDPSHSQIVFRYDHMGFSTSYGFVNGVEGRVTLDPADPGAASVEASFPLSALRTIDAALDAHLMGPDFFNVSGEVPVVTFTSTSVRPDGDDEARVTGDLTLNGVTRPVELKVEYNGAGIDPVSERVTIGFDIEAEIRRSDFNLGAFVPAVGDKVRIDISVEARRQD
ncbi:MAG: YceI family protein [Paracoccus sp. (in: a-proteobacteria)]|nr:YceI family protein [Paracoccus sp. (in: a-proteobacteria)]